MEGDGTQTGGVEPGLAALIASLLSGAVGYVGWKKDMRSADEKALEKLKAWNQADASAAQAAEARAKAELETKTKEKDAKIRELQSQIDQLTKDKQSLQDSAASDPERNAIFRSATKQALTDAIDDVVSDLQQRYAWMQSKSMTNLRKALLYPTKYQAQLNRITLIQFWESQVRPALEKDATSVGGTKRRYRRHMYGGDETPIPSYDEFATLYTNRLRSSAKTERQRVEEKVEAAKKATDERVKAKQDATAMKTAQTVIPKLESAVADAEKALRQNESLVGLLSEERQVTLNTKSSDLSALVQQAREILGAPAVQELAAPKKRFGFFGGAASNLREVKTVEDWDTLNKQVSVSDLLQNIKDKTKDYIQAVRDETKAEKKSFNVPKIEFGLPKIKIPSPTNPFAPIAKRLSDTRDARAQADLVRSNSKNAVDFMKAVLKKADAAIKEVETNEKARARRNRKGGARDPPYEDRRRMDGYMALTVEDLARNLRAVARGGTETVGIKSYTWSEKPDGELHPLSFYLDQLNTSVFSGAVDLYIAATTGKPRDFSVNVFLAAGEQYVLVKSYLEDIISKLKIFDTDRATRLERIAMGAESIGQSVKALVARLMGLFKDVSAKVENAPAGAPLPPVITKEKQEEMNALVAKFGRERVEKTIGRIRASIQTYPPEQRPVKERAAVFIEMLFANVPQEAVAPVPVEPPLSNKDIDDLIAAGPSVSEEELEAAEKALGPVDEDGAASVAQTDTATGSPESLVPTASEATDSPASDTQLPAQVSPLLLPESAPVPSQDSRKAYEELLAKTRRNLRPPPPKGGRPRHARKRTLKKRRGGK